MPKIDAEMHPFTLALLIAFGECFKIQSRAKCPTETFSYVINTEDWNIVGEQTEKANKLIPYAFSQAIPNVTRKQSMTADKGKWGRLQAKIHGIHTPLITKNKCMIVCILIERMVLQFLSLQADLLV